VSACATAGERPEGAAVDPVRAGQVSTRQDYGWNSSKYVSVIIQRSLSSDKASHPPRNSTVVANFNSCATATNSMAYLRAADATVVETANTDINFGGFFGHS
jgi:hypothetical protein